MKKVFAYILWGIISLPFLVIVKSIAQGKFPQYSFLIMGSAFGLVVYAFLLVKRYAPQKATATQEYSVNQEDRKRDRLIASKDSQQRNIPQNTLKNVKKSPTKVNQPPSKKSQPAKPLPIKTKKSLVIKKEQAVPNRENEEFPYMAELSRRIYAHLLKETKDEATMLQAKVECGTDKDKIETTYYKLRYKQIIESGAADKLKAEILAKNQQKDVSTQAQKPLTKKNPSDVTVNGRFDTNPSGIVKDTETGLEWVAGPDKDTTWHEAKEWVDNLNIDGRGWRMPTTEELETLCEPGVGACNMVPALNTSGQKVWSDQTKSSSAAWAFRFYMGCKGWDYFANSYHLRAFAVRCQSY